MKKKLKENLKQTKTNKMQLSTIRYETQQV